METNENWPDGSRKNIEATVPKKFRKETNRTEIVGLNWALLFLCIGSIGISGILAYRQIQLESRLTSLEGRCDHQETSEVIVKRLRREVQDAFLGQKIPYPEGGIFRVKRDVSDCNCPAGKFINSCVFLRIYIHKHLLYWKVLFVLFTNGPSFRIFPLTCKEIFFISLLPFFLLFTIDRIALKFYSRVCEKFFSF